jgi:hypothetical protein
MLASRLQLFGPLRIKTWRQNELDPSQYTESHPATRFLGGIEQPTPTFTITKYAKQAPLTEY